LITFLVQPRRLGCLDGY